MTDPFSNAYSAELERGILGAVLDGRKQEAAAILIDVCPLPEYFWLSRHQTMARVLALMLAQGERIDAMSVILALQRIRHEDILVRDRPMRFEPGILAEDSLAAAIPPNDVLDFLPNSCAFVDLRRNCELLRDLYAQRQGIIAMQEALDDVRGVGGAGRLPQAADRLLSTMARLTANQTKTRTASEAMAHAISQHHAVRDKVDRGEHVVASWGMGSLDASIPLSPCQLIVLAAQPNHGKSSLALQSAMATTEALGGGSVGIINQEMPAEQIGSIILARETQVRSRAIAGGMLDPEKIARLEEAVVRWRERDVFLRCPDRLTIDQIIAWIRQQHLRSGGRLQLVVIDYLQLIQPRHGRQSEQEKLSEATAELKGIANSLRLCVLALSQMNREGAKADRDSSGRLKQNPEPRLQDLRGSGTIEQDADGVVFIWPPVEVSGADLPVFLKIAKNRSGPKKTLEAVFERGNGQVFRQMGGTPSDDTSRKHHNHPPKPEEDKYAAMQAEQAQETQP